MEGEHQTARVRLCGDGIQLAQERLQYRAFVHTAMNLRSLLTEPTDDRLPMKTDRQTDCCSPKDAIVRLPACAHAQFVVEITNICGFY
jgi:hypothetical protein